MALGAAGAVALGGAGLYASSLTATATGSLGAGETTAQASCATAVNVTAGLATYQTTLVPVAASPGYGYNDVDVAITEANDGDCDAKKVMVTVYDQSSGDASVIASSTGTVSDTVGTAETVNVTFASYVAASDDLSYAVVIQDTAT